jgi:uncharacterized protein (DUF1684 family)
MLLKKITGVVFTSVSFIVTISLLLSTLSCQQKTVQGYEADLKKFRKEKHKNFLSSKSPLSEEERSNFVGLNYFPPDSNFLKTAAFKRIQSPDTLEFETNTDRKPKYISLGELHFTINDTMCKLILFKPLNPEDTTLFLPFTDATNGLSTYYTGRYVDISPSSLGDSVLVDFNRSYNPYCAYSDRYSCPIPPRSNQLSVKITAGEKLYKTNH